MKWTASTVYMVEIAEKTDWEDIKESNGKKKETPVTVWFTRLAGACENSWNFEMVPGTGIEPVQPFQADGF